MTVLEIKQYQHNELIWEAYNIPNIFHQLGEKFVLSVAFDTDAHSVPASYYLGLDNRSTLAYADDIGCISGEPSTNGYARQAISSISGFGTSLVDGRMKATSGIITFTATGGSWGPVNNVFLATTINSSGILVASSALSSSRTLTSGQHMTVRFGLAFTVC